MRILAALALACAVSSQAHADTSTNSGGSIYHIAQICSFDIQQYCKGISVKRIRDMKACLANNEKNLLPRCQDHYKEARQ